MSDYCFIDALLKKWNSFSSPSSLAYSKCNCKYEIQRRNEKLQNLNSTWDTTGLMGLIYAKSTCEHMLYNIPTNVLDILVESDFIQLQKDSSEMWQMFNSNKVINVENAFMKFIQSIIVKTTKAALLGDFSKEDIEMLWDCTRDTIESLDKCRVESYVKGDTVGELTYINSSIIVFETLAECLTTLEKQDVKDGIYICYINCYGSVDGYFGFFIKSNGNLFSLNERLHEAYPGQHQYTRNGRYLDNKAYRLFPYSFIVDFTGDTDYLGYAKSSKLDSDKLEIFKLDKKAYMPIVLALYLIIRRFSNSKNNYNQVYVDSLMKVNIQPMLDCKALTVVNNSALITVNDSFKIPFNTEDVISSRLGKKYSFDHKDKTKRYDEVGSFVDADYDVEADRRGMYSHSKGPALKLIKYFGDGFQYDAQKTFTRNNLQLTTSASETNDKPYVNEIIGNKSRMEMIAYYQARKQLAEYIKDSMYKEFQEFGGNDGVDAWYKNVVQSNYDNILNILIWHYINNTTQEYDGFAKPITEKGLIIYQRKDPLGWHPFNETPKGYWSSNIPVIDQTNGKPCNLWFYVNINNATGFKEILGDTSIELPKIMECYDSCRSHLGNSILDATDAVTHLYLPYEDVSANKNWQNRVEFTFSVGFSKSGWNKLVNQYKAKHLK